MERGDQPGVTTFFVPGLARGVIALPEDAAHHALVKRLEPGGELTLTDGRGSRAGARLVSLTRKGAEVEVDEIATVQAPPAIHLHVPVADRDRMLWLGEKAVELQASSWTPVMFRRSRSVNPRGEGESFERKLMARMIGALEQSGGSWLPRMNGMVEVEAAVPEVAAAYVFDRSGERFAPGAPQALALLVGPEGGFDAGELQALRDRGWSLASLGGVTLRFETAALAALTLGRAMLQHGGS